MERHSSTAWFRGLAAGVFLILATGVLLSCGGGGDGGSDIAAGAKTACASGDNPESGLQGQSTLAERMGGSSSRGINCNLQLMGQFQGEGAYHAQTWIDDCSYYSTANGTGQLHQGVAVIDVADPTNPKATAYLNARSFWQTWESLKISTARHLIAAVQSDGGSGTDPGFAVYDVTNCRQPSLRASVNLPIPPGTTIKGHGGAISPDGRTYYGTTFPVSLYIIDIADPTQPTLMTNWVPPDGVGQPHDLSISRDNNRAYVLQPASGAVKQDGVVILDVSDFNQRKPNPQVRVVSTLYWNGGTGMTSEPITVKGKPYLLVSDESQAGSRSAACTNGTPVFGYARLIDISDEKHPFVVSELKLEVDDPKNCDKLANDPAYLTSSFGYSAHYCTADNRDDALLVACSRHEAGIRVYSIADPKNPVEIAYYKPPIHTGENLPGSGINGTTSRTYDWNKSHSRFLSRNGNIELWTTSADNGFQVLRFESSLTTRYPALFANVASSLQTITVP